MQLNRNYFTSKQGSAELHILFDVLLEGMCMVTYFREKTECGAQLSFVVGICRIAPMKQQTIPKPEPHAALYAVRFRQLIIEGHDNNICACLSMDWLIDCVAMDKCSSQETASVHG